MTPEEKKQKRAELKALFLKSGLKASKLAEVLQIDKATVYTACNPDTAREISWRVLDRVEQYLKKAITNLNN